MLKFKKVIIVLMFFSILIFFKSNVNAFTIVLDPGHGGTDSGAIAKNGEYERDLNMKVANYLKEYLADYNVDVYLTRSSSNEFLSILERGLFIRSKNADIGISLHFNAAPTAQNGAEVWVTNNTSLSKYKKNSTELGNKILDNLSELGIANRGVKTRLSTGDTTDAYTDGTRSDYYGIIRYSMRGCKIDYGVISPKGSVPANVQNGEGVPAIIIEHCFVDGNDYKFINSDSKLKKIAEADGKAIVDYYNLSLKSKEVTATTLTVTPGNSKTQTNFSWTKEDNANTYNLKIKKGTVGNVSMYKEIADLTDISYNIKLPAGYYEVCVEASNDSSCQSSNIVEFNVEQGTTTISKPETLVTKAKVASTTNNSAKLTWKKAKNCDSYVIYRYNTKKEKWKKLATIAQSETSYTVTGLSSGTNYKFAIKTCNSGSNKDYVCDEYVTVSGTTKLKEVKNIKAISAQTSIKLTWNELSGAQGYIVYMYNSSTKKWESYKKVSGTKKSVKITGLSAGKTYKFRVKAYKKVDGKEVLSNSYKTIKAATNPAKVSFKLKSSKKKTVTVSWSKVSGATGYIVYYKTSANGSWKKLTTTTKTNYTKTGLSSGKTYYFAVKAYKTYDGKNYNGNYKSKSIKVK